LLINLVANKPRVHAHREYIHGQMVVTFSRRLIKNFKPVNEGHVMYGGHVMRSSSGEAHLYILEGQVCGKRPRGRPRLTWMDDIIDWTGLKSYENVKRIAEDRNRWKTIVVNLL